MYFAQPSKPFLIQSARSSFDRCPRRGVMRLHPRIIVTGLEHVATVVRLDHDRRAAAQPLGNERRDVTKIHHGSDLHTLMRRSKTEIVDGVVRDGKRMKIDLADAEVFARLDLLDAIAQRFNAPRGSSLLTLNRSLT